MPHGGQNWCAPTGITILINLESRNSNVCGHGFGGQAFQKYKKVGGGQGVCPHSLRKVLLMSAPIQAYLSGWINTLLQRLSSNDCQI